MCRLFKSFCVVIVLCFHYCFSINEECIIKGLPGRCKYIKACADANFVLSTGEISFCQFEGLETQICCPDKQKLADIKKVPINKSSSKQDGIPLSVKKCMEYHPVFEGGKIFVAGGQLALSKQYPHMAIIGFGDENNIEWLCGGSLISLNFVLTAAHCIYSNQYGAARWVRLGDLDLSTDKDDAAPQDFQIIRTIAHPNYNYPSRYNDIALLELDRNVVLSPYVSPACLQTTKIINDTTMYATGWGRTDFAGSNSNFLMTLKLNAIDGNECQGFYKDSSKAHLSNGIVDDIMICAGGEIGKDTCGGDSGGPLQVKNWYRSMLKEVSNIVGITSFGKACGLSESPGVYTRVSHYSNWIESIVWPNEF